MIKEKFQPAANQIDFTHARWAPVINCVLKHQGRILVVERSAKLNFYPEYWNGISGFLDDQKSLQEKVIIELQEELGLKPEDIEWIRLAEIFDREEPKYNKTWVVHPVLVEVKTDRVKLDWEAQNYRWIKPEEAQELDLMPGFGEVLEKVSEWL